MRTLTLAAFALTATVAGAGCGTSVVAFDVPIEAETTIDGGGGGEVLDAFGFGDLAEVDLADRDEFDDNDVQRKQVIVARLTTLNLTIAAPQGADFDWLDELSFSIEADGQTTTRVANKIIADGAAAFSCDLDDVDLAPFVRARRFALTSEATALRPPQDTTVRADLVFAISAEVE